MRELNKDTKVKVPPLGRVYKDLIPKGPDFEEVRRQMDQAESTGRYLGRGVRIKG